MVFVYGGKMKEEEKRDAEVCLFFKHQIVLACYYTMPISKIQEQRFPLTLAAT